MSLVTIALDRYLAVLNQSKSKFLQSKLVCFSGFAIIWLISGTISSRSLFSYYVADIYVVPDSEEHMANFYQASLCMVHSLVCHSINFITLTSFNSFTIRTIPFTSTSSCLHSFSLPSRSLSFGSTPSLRRRFGSDVTRPALARSRNEAMKIHQRKRSERPTRRTRAPTCATIPLKFRRGNRKILPSHHDRQFSLFNRRCHLSRTMKLIATGDSDDK